VSLWSAIALIVVSSLVREQSWPAYHLWWAGAMAVAGTCVVLAISGVVPYSERTAQDAPRWSTYEITVISCGILGVALWLSGIALATRAPSESSLPIGAGIALLPTLLLFVAGFILPIIAAALLRRPLFRWWHVPMIVLPWSYFAVRLAV
jgi:uncharacterized membrane protein